MKSHSSFAPDHFMNLDAKTTAAKGVCIKLDLEFGVGVSEGGTARQHSRCDLPNLSDYLTNV